MKDEEKENEALEETEALREIRIRYLIIGRSQIEVTGEK